MLEHWVLQAAGAHETRSRKPKQRPITRTVLGVSTLRTPTGLPSLPWRASSGSAAGGVNMLAANGGGTIYTQRSRRDEGHYVCSSLATTAR